MGKAMWAALGVSGIRVLRLLIALQTSHRDMNDTCLLGSSSFDMSVTRRNTFDLFDEEEDLHSSSETKFAQKKKRRKKKTSIDTSLRDASQDAADRVPANDHRRHEVCLETWSTTGHAHGCKG